MLPLAKLRVEAEGTEVAAVVVEGRLLLVLGLVVERGDAEREHVVDCDVVEVAGFAEGAVVVDAALDRVGVLEGRGVDRRVDDACRATDAEQDGVRSALEVDATHVVAIPRDFREEVVAGVVGRIETADAGVLAGAQQVGGARRRRSCRPRQLPWIPPTSVLVV